MSMMIKTNFGEFHFNLDKQDEQEILNLAMNKATGRSEAKCMNAPVPTVPNSAPEPVPVAKLLKNAADVLAENVHTGGTNMANALKRATEAAVPAQAEIKSRAERLFGDRGNWDMPAAEKKDTEKKESYTGFLHIKCNKCGEVKTFYCKHYMTFFKCGECGHSFNLRDLKPAHARCGCGAYQTYHTNETDAEIKIPCKACRVPTKLILNKAGTTYVMPKPWDNIDG